MKRFDIPTIYKSDFIKKIKEIRQNADPRKKDVSPTEINFGPVTFVIARHFGFCYGVENAIERSYRAIRENPNKKIYLLSQMIHNPDVNNDLQAHGIQFIMNTAGDQLIPWDSIHAEDIVIIPAFGTTVEIKQLLTDKGVEIDTYDTTCPFVTRVWKRSEQLGKKNFTIIIHGKHNHEETRATYSQSIQNSHALVIRNMEEAEFLSKVIKKEQSSEDFYRYFEGKYSEGFDPEIHLDRIGVVNQTTMLASETSAISEFLKLSCKEYYGEESFKNHIAETRDTLCYATNENQDATFGMLENKADLAIVVGGYNSSNTSHLVELCEEKLKTYFICNASEIKSKNEIHHFDYPNKQLLVSMDFLEMEQALKIMISSGASCPDTVVDTVIERILSFYPETKSMTEVLSELEDQY